MLIKYRIGDLPRWLRDFAPLVLWMALIFFLSSRSRLVEIEGAVQEKLFFKTAHMAAYATMAWLWWRALSPRRRVVWVNLAVAFGLTVLYGISDEFHQLYVPGRHGQLADVLFDTAGALLMVLLLRRANWLRIFPDNLPIWFFKSRDADGQSSGDKFRVTG